MKKMIFAMAALMSGFALAADPEPPREYEKLTASEKEQFLLTQFENSEYNELPSWNGLEPLRMLALAVPLRDKARSEYMGVTVERKSDFMPKGRGKPVHTYGSTGTIRFVVERDLGYTGLLSSGTQHGVARFSLAAKPGGSTTPGLALKFLVDGVPSRNVQVMYSLEGQSSYNFFENSFSNALKAPSGGPLKLLEPIFAAVSNNPFKLGLSHLADTTESGEPVQQVVYPEEIRLIPTGEFNFADAPHEIRDDLATVPSGSRIYDVWTVRKDGDQPEYLGYIETTSRLIASQFGDKQLFFNHQRKEADSRR